MTPQRIRKALYIPGIGVIAYMLFTVYFFEFGPRDWNPENKNVLYSYLLLYIAAFAAGYFLYLKMGSISKIANRDIKQAENSQRKTVRFLQAAVWLDVSFTFLNAMQYANIGSYNVLDLLRAVRVSMANPVGAYYEIMLIQMEGISGTTLVTWVTVLLAPVLLSARVLGVLYFKELKNVQKAAVAFAVFLDICRWMALGKNKGIFDIVILFLMIFVVRWVQRRAAGKRMDKKKAVLILLCIGLAFMYFGFLMSFRSSGASGLNYEGFEKIPWSLFPQAIRPMLLSLNSYLCQGYFGLSLCMSMEWIPTWGLGFSGWFNRMFEAFLGIGAGANTYQARAEVFGWSSTGRWHTMYSWFANDIHFLGVIILMFFLGMMFAVLIKETVFEKNGISAALLYLMFIQIVYISANNQVFAVSNTAMAFIVLFFFWIFQKLRKRTAWKKGNDGRKYC